MLADWALFNKQMFFKKHVLELGAGVGFTGITIAKYCAIESMTMSDHHPEVLQVICDNIEINFQSAKKCTTSHSTVYEINDKTIGINIILYKNFYVKIHTVSKTFYLF